MTQKQRISSDEINQPPCDYYSDDGIVSDDGEIINSSSSDSNASSSHLSSVDVDISGSDKGSTTSLRPLTGQHLNPWYDCVSFVLLVIIS